MQFVVNEEGALSHQRVGVYHELWQVVDRTRGRARSGCLFPVPVRADPSVSGTSLDACWASSLVLVLSSWGAFPISGPKFSEQK